MDSLGHLSPQIHIQSHSSVNSLPVFLKVYLWYALALWKKSDGSRVSLSLSW